jgi:hypothetical protein
MRLRQIVGEGEVHARAVLLGARTHRLGAEAQHGAQVERRLVDLELPSFDLGKVQDVVDQAEQAVGRAADDLHVLGLLVGEVGHAEQLAHTDHAVHGRADSASTA